MRVEDFMLLAAPPAGPIDLADGREFVPHRWQPTWKDGMLDGHVEVRLTGLVRAASPRPAVPPAAGVPVVVDGSLLCVRAERQVAGDAVAVTVHVMGDDERPPGTPALVLSAEAATELAALLRRYARRDAA